jgi:RNA polymerase sigma-70 factor (ECF subfamily)
MGQPTSNPSAPPVVDPDVELVHRAKAGDYAAFEQLVSKYERPLYSLAMRIVRNSADAEEIVQDAFLAVVEHVRDFAEQSKFYTWLVRIATHQALKVLRKKKGLPTTSLAAPSSDDDYAGVPHPDFIADWREGPDRIVQRREVQQLLDEALGELDDKYRLVFVLRDIQGLSTEDTAGILGITASNVKVRLLRARLMLRERLTRQLGDETRRIIANHDHETDSTDPP